MIEYADFLNALRAGRVGEPTSRRMTPEGMRTVATPCDQRLDWALHNYTFPAITELPEQYFYDVRERGIDLFLASQLRLPFDPVVYIVPVEAGDVRAVFYRLTQVDDRRLAVSTYNWLPELNGAFKPYSGWIVPHPDDPTDVGFELIPPRIKGGNLERLMATTVAAVQNGITLTAMLTLPQAEPALELTMPGSAKLDAINLGRSLGKRPRLVPLARVIRIRVDEASRIVWKTGPRPHGSPSPHDRKAHERRLKNGDTIMVKSAKVRGGARQPVSTTVLVEEV
jgi:hypothetical protein